MSLIAELKKRSVFRVGAAYVVVAWVLLQIADVMVPALRLPDWVMSGVALVLMLGFPVALVLAWAFELTPGGLKREAEVNRDASPQPASRRVTDALLIGLLVIVVAFVAWDQWSGEPAPQVTEEVAQTEEIDRSVAVLPFVAMSSGADDEYFADGLTEEILNVLAKLPTLEVTARTSSFFFKGKDIPVPEIAERLGVAQVVEGSVRRDGERVRITAQLIRASDGFHLWSERYDRTLEDVFAVQEDIAENIADVLNVVLDDDTRRAMRNAGIGEVGAFIDYQKGLEIFAQAHSGLANIAPSLVEANLYFDRVLEVAPQLARVWMQRTDRAAHIVFDHAIGLREASSADEAQAALEDLIDQAQTAMRLSEPGHQRDVLELETQIFLDDWRGVPALIEKAMQPGSCPDLNWTMEFITAFGYAPQIVSKMRELRACDPVNWSANLFLPLTLIWVGEPQTALAEIAAARAVGVTHPWLQDAEFLTLVAAGRMDDPVVTAPQPSTSGMYYDRRLLVAAVSGDAERARTLAEAHWANPNSDRWSSLLVAAIVGDRERANELAAAIDREPGGQLALSSSVFNCYCGAPFDLDATPRYQARVKEAGFPWPPSKPFDLLTKDW